MRENKYRVWHVTQRCMYKVTNIRFDADSGLPKGISGDGLVYTTFMGVLELLQYTGLKDSKGQDIYEGDIVKGSYDQYGDKIVEVREVKYDEQMQLTPLHDIVGYDCELWMDEAKFEVIGNIYENPELVKV